MKKLFGTLFWKVFLIFLLILIVVTAVYMYISVYTAEMYFQETRQKLDYDVAKHIASDNVCFVGDSVNREVLENVFHNIMVINPSIEVYLLNPSGKILTYYAPNGVIKLKIVPLKPINKFINSVDHRFLMGVDPKKPESEKAFSAAKVFEEGRLKGYIYVILGGEELENASQMVFGSYILRLGVRSMTIALIAAVLAGFLAIRYLTRNIRQIINVVREFQRGNLKARIKGQRKGELSEFSNAFNEMADTIVANIDQVKKADSLRRELIANVSHDLRTPISIVRGYVETALIREDKLSTEERRKYLETILSSTDRLLKLVEELFELSKLEANDKILQLERISFAELLQDVHQKNMLLAQSKNIEMKLHLCDFCPLVNADVSMMEKVFQNLIDNAIKFTPEGGYINLSVNNIFDQEILIEIADSGYGIPEDQVPYIFDKYYQIKRVSENTNNGTGLGLAIVKRIIDLHNFKIYVQSSVNKGTKFKITAYTA